jgi:hypothetical protein
MDTMHIDPAAVVSAELSGPAGALRPVVFREGDSFCCLLGHDPQTGVMGCGSTPDAAVQDWNDRLKQHLAEHDDDDYIVQYVRFIVGPKRLSDQGKAFNDYLNKLAPPNKKAP